MSEKLTIKTPGKLMLAGEFAVLEPNHQLLVMAVDRFVYCYLQDAEQFTLSLPDLAIPAVKWEFDGEEVQLVQDDVRTNFVKEALKTTLLYLQAQNITITPFHLEIQSELDDEASGAKYGLGSSAAVVTAIVTAVLTKFYKKHMSKKLIFKLAAIAHTAVQGSGSGADIAASTYGGVLGYKSFQAEWLLKQLEIYSVADLVALDWQYLSIGQLMLPQETTICIGWTGSPASTVSLVSEVKQLKQTNPEAYHKFLADSEAAVGQIIASMERQDMVSFYAGIEANRKALSTLGDLAGVAIETETLAQLSRDAMEVGGAGKLSGAGGGDCGIAFIPKTADRAGLFTLWESHQIIPLNLTIYPFGARMEITE